MRLRVGEVCAGYGGLSMAVEEVFAASPAWFSEYDAAPSKILAHHYPDVPNYGDMTKIDWAAIEHVDIISGGTPCFPPGTLISTSTGLVPIEKIQLGDMVLTHERRYKPVVQLMSRRASDTVRVEAMGSPIFTTTEDHPFWAREIRKIWDNDLRKYRRQWGPAQWVKASDLTKSHFLGQPLDEESPIREPLGVDLAYIVGRWLGDGWIRDGKRTSNIPQGKRGSRVGSQWWHVMLCSSHGEGDGLASAIERAGLHASRSHERTTARFQISAKWLVELLAEFGRGATGKELPGWVFTLPREDQKALWRGWADADGSYAPNGAERVTTVSERLAHGMARVGRNVYQRAVSVHKFEVPPTATIEGRTVNQNHQYQVVLPTRNREAFLEDGWVWVPVRSVKPTAAAEVYNFGVQDDESYTAWGYTVHNCQDLSAAGRRAGMNEGTRSNLWVQMREAIAIQRPRYVVWENVRGAFSACASSEMGQCPRCVGGRGPHQPFLRALGRVLGDLSDLGYDCQWRGLRAADVGGVHARFRVFVLARRRGPITANSDVPGRGEQRRPVAVRTEHPAAEHSGTDVTDPDSCASGRGSDTGNAGGGPSEIQDVTDADSLGLERPRDSRGRWTRPADSCISVADTEGVGRGEGRAESKGIVRGLAAAGDSASTADANRGNDDGRIGEQKRCAFYGTPTPRCGQVTRADIFAGRWCDCEPPTDASGAVLGEHPGEPSKEEAWPGSRDGSSDPHGERSPDNGGEVEINWGDYEPAIRRWERIIGRSAPRPTEPTGRNGGHRLSPRLTEWMMGMPDGWVTDPAIGISRNEQLKACGNGVVPHQATAALRDMLAAFRQSESRS